MPYTSAHKARTRARIVASARGLFNRRGFSEVSIDEIMAAAGLTRGGFYNHFATKDELYAEAVTSILVDHPAKNWEGVDLDLEGPALAAAVIKAYLGPQHFGDIAGSCPMIALPSDVARGGAAVKTAFRQVLEAMIGIFAENQAQRQKNGEAREDALAISALCVGGMVLARAIDDRTLGKDIRRVCTDRALQLGGWHEGASA